MNVSRTVSWVPAGVREYLFLMRDDRKPVREPDFEFRAAIAFDEQVRLAVHPDDFEGLTYARANIGAVLRASLVRGLEAAALLMVRERSVFHPARLAFHDTFSEIVSDAMSNNNIRTHSRHLHKHLIASEMNKVFASPKPSEKGGAR